jgi:hypothetical protein
MTNSGGSNSKELLLRALQNVQDEEAQQGPASPQTMILRAMNLAPHDREAADQAYTLGGEIIRVTEHTLGLECWEWAVRAGERVKPHGGDGGLTPGDPPQGTLFAMLLAMRLGREIGRLESP